MVGKIMHTEQLRLLSLLGEGNRKILWGWCYVQLYHNEKSDLLCYCHIFTNYTQWSCYVKLSPAQISMSCNGGNYTFRFIWQRFYMYMYKCWSCYMKEKQRDFLWFIHLHVFIFKWINTNVVGVDYQ